MNIIRRNPSAPRAVENQFGRLTDSLFDDTFGPFGGALSQWHGEALASPRLNVSETEAAFQVQAELPGVKKEDVKVAIDRARVTIEAESQRENQSREGESMLYSERSASRFMRSFTLPCEVDEGGAEARMENGVLSLTLPKKRGSEAKRITIQ